MKYEILLPAGRSTIQIPQKAVYEAGFENLDFLNAFAEKNTIFIIKKEMSAEEILNTVDFLNDFSTRMLLSLLMEVGYLDEWEEGACCCEDCGASEECEKVAIPPCVFEEGQPVNNQVSAHELLRMYLVPENMISLLEGTGISFERLIEMINSGKRIEIS